MGRLRRYNLNKKKAAETLNNVFAACNREVDIPFDKLLLKQKANYVSDRIYICVAAVLLVLSLIAPMFFPHSDTATVFVEETENMTVSWHKLEHNLFFVAFEGDTVDGEKSYMEDFEGNRFNPVSVDTDENLLVFSFDGGEYNIYAYSDGGKCIQMILKGTD